MTTGLVLLFAMHGCGHALLEISACWMQEDGVECRFAELGCCQSLDYAGLWSRVYRYLRKSDRECRIQVVFDKDMAEERCHLLTALLSKYQDVAIVPWRRDFEMIAVIGPLGRYLNDI